MLAGVGVLPMQGRVTKICDFLPQKIASNQLQ